MRKMKALFAVTVVAMAIGFALPSTALAAYTTRIYFKTGTSFNVDKTVAGSSVVTPTVQGKLQRYYNGAWRDVAGTIKFYRYNPDGTVNYMSGISKYYSSGRYFAISMTQRGKYKVYVPATSSLKSVTKYAYRRDMISAGIDLPTVERTDLGDGNSSLKITQTVAWNDTDYAGMSASIDDYITYYDSADPYFSTYNDYDAYRTINKPGTYVTTFVVPNADIFDSLLRYCEIDFEDPYVVDRSAADELL